jgi:hypothetical protein
MSQKDLSPKEAANRYLGDSVNRQEWLFEHPPEDLIEFIRLKNGRADALDIQYLFAMLNFRIAEEAAKSANKLHEEMEKLVEIARVQRLLAEKLERQTDKVIWLTRALIILTIVLILEGGCQFFEGLKPRI